MNDPNRTDDVLYMLQMIGKVTSVRLEAVENTGGCREWGPIERAEVARLVYNLDRLTG